MERYGGYGYGGGAGAGQGQYQSGAYNQGGTPNRGQGAGYAPNSQSFGGGGGGGFFNSPSGAQGTGNAYGAGFGSQDNSRPAQADRTLTPVFIRQLQLANVSPSNDSKFVLDGHDLNQVKVVGVITNVQVQSTNIAYTVDDSTGSIEVKIWQGENDDDPEMARQRSELVDGVYVRVFGKVQEYNSVRTLSGFSLKPITDYNEIANHMAQVTLSYLKTTKGPVGAKLGAKQEGSGPPHPALATSLGGVDMGSFTPIQADIMSCFGQVHLDENGLSVSAITNFFGGKYTQGQTRQTVEFLTAEGHLYSTIDDDHYKPTSMM